jgi:DNA-directed RNA polymerase I, II, and III subunit RPABC1|tara:strand:+ start:58 stop:744 length:687 start_codon:yes stop_codon:yes gene_type:complete
MEGGGLGYEEEERPPFEGLKGEALQMFNVRRVVYQMLEARGYLVDPDDLNMSQEDYADSFGKLAREDGKCTISVQSKDGGDMLYVFFLDNKGKPKIGIQPLQGVIQNLQAMGSRRAIIIVQSSLTSMAYQTLGEMEASHDYHIEHFQDDELFFNIMEHELVPRHEILTAAEKKQLLDRYRLAPRQLPKIQRYDPVARFLGLRKDQVVRITRYSETAGRYVTYRICIEG